MQEVCCIRAPDILDFEGASVLFSASNLVILCMGIEGHMYACIWNVSPRYALIWKVLPKSSQLVHCLAWVGLGLAKCLCNVIGLLLELC